MTATRMRHDNAGWLNTSQVDRRDGVLAPHRPHRLGRSAHERAAARVSVDSACRESDVCRRGKDARPHGRASAESVPSDRGQRTGGHRVDHPAGVVLKCFT